MQSTGAWLSKSTLATKLSHCLLHFKILQETTNLFPIFSPPVCSQPLHLWSFSSCLSPFILVLFGTMIFDWDSQHIESELSLWAWAPTALLLHLITMPLWVQGWRNRIKKKKKKILLGMKLTFPAVCISNSLLRLWSLHLHSTLLVGWLEAKHRWAFIHTNTFIDAHQTDKHTKSSFLTLYIIFLTDATDGLNSKFPFGTKIIFIIMIKCKKKNNNNLFSWISALTMQKVAVITFKCFL